MKMKALRFILPCMLVFSSTGCATILRRLLRSDSSSSSSSSSGSNSGSGSNTSSGSSSSSPVKSYAEVLADIKEA